MSKPKSKATYNAIIKHNDPWWNGWIAEVPGVNAQEKSREKLLESLHIALAEAIAMNRDAAIEVAGMDYTEVEITL